MGSGTPPPHSPKMNKKKHNTMVLVQHVQFLGYGTTQHGTVRYGMVRYSMLRYVTVRYGTLRYVMVLRYGTEQFGRKIQQKFKTIKFK